MALQQYRKLYSNIVPVLLNADTKAKKQREVVQQ